MKRFLLLMVVALLVAACAHDRKSTSDRLDLYRIHAGEPVASFQYSQNLRWTPLGDQALAVWTRNNQGYLLELAARCPNLDFAHAIRITHSMRRVSARFDSVHALASTGGGSRASIPCRIHTIRPLDSEGLRADREEMRDAQTIEREPGAGEE